MGSISILPPPWEVGINFPGGKLFRGLHFFFFALRALEDMGHFFFSHFVLLKIWDISFFFALRALEDMGHFFFFALRALGTIDLRSMMRGTLTPPPLILPPGAR